MTSRAMLCAALFAACVTPGHAIDCGRAESATERTICASPSLRQQDASMSQRYDGVRGEAATAVVRNALASGQRAWLHRRDTDCVVDAACLGRLYGSRIETLTSLDNAGAGSGDGRLHDPDTVSLSGTWIAEQLPSGIPPQHATDVGRSGKPISIFDPPRPGSRITISPSRVCIETGDCTDISWRWARLGDASIGPGLARDLHLSATQRILIGRPAAKQGEEVLLMPGRDGAIAALASLCSANGDCRSVSQSWQPAGAVALPAP